MLGKLYSDLLKRFVIKRKKARTPIVDRGRRGEDEAVRFLKKEKGMRIVARNWTHKKDEIDIIARDREVLTFVEVRSRKEDALISGYHTVGKQKKERLRRASKVYLKRLKHPPKHFRFDIVEVKLCKNGESVVNHYSNIPLFSKHFHVSYHG